MSLKKFLSIKGNLWLAAAAVLGLCLILFSAFFSGKSESDPADTPESFELCEARLEERLVELISQLEGVSQVRVMLTLEDMPKGSERPRVRGVAVVCAGCEDSGTRMRIVMLIAGALGITSDKIFVSSA